MGRAGCRTGRGPGGARLGWQVASCESDARMVLARARMPAGSCGCTQGWQMQGQGCGGRSAARNRMLHRAWQMPLVTG